MWRSSAFLFCYDWSCVTTGEARWNPSSSWDLGSVKRNTSNNWECLRSTVKLLTSTCRYSGAGSPLQVSFPNPGTQVKEDWPKGKLGDFHFIRKVMVMGYSLPSS